MTTSALLTMKRRLSMTAALLIAAFMGFVAGAPAIAADAQGGEHVIRALLVTGGCCHDYPTQKMIIPAGIDARTNLKIKWTVVLQGGKTTNTMIPLYKDPDWSKDYDIVVHNECFAAVKDKDFVEGILKPHREGLPSIVIHCAMHCYRTGSDDWFKYCGVTSRNHGPHYAYTVDNVAKDNPIMKGWGDSWEVPKGELYNIEKLWDTATVLATAKRRNDGKPQAVVWTNQYGKGRVFGTTMGHYNVTMGDDKYMAILTRGFLWAIDKLDEKNLQKPSAESEALMKKILGGQAKAPANAKPTKPTKQAKQAKLPTKCCTEGNLAHAKPVKASSEETGKNNLVAHAIDGDPGTRWCGANASSPQWWQVDLGQVQDVKNIRIIWEAAKAAYQYKVEASGNGSDWSTAVDASGNKQVSGIVAHEIKTPARFLRVVYLGSNTGAWGSIREFEAYAGDLPKLPDVALADKKKSSNPA